MPSFFTDHSQFEASLSAVTDAPRWVVAFSGGLDSCVLLHLLTQWAAANPSAPPLSALHINHGIQAAAADWQSHCEALCGEWQVPVVSRSVNVGERASPEAAAREARYSVFAEEIGEGEVLFLGHHLDDQIETFFLRLLRGAGLEGLSAMPDTRELGRGRLLRPLLDVSRTELESYAGAHALSFIEDPSNSDTTLDRNFLRQEVLPLLASRWPGYRQTVARASGHLSQARTNLAVDVGVPATCLSAMGDIGVALTDIDGAGGISAAHLRAWLGGNALRAPDQAALEEFIRQLNTAQDDMSPTLCCGDYTLQRFAGAVYLRPSTECAAPTTVIHLRCGERCQIPGVGEITLEPTSEPGLRLTQLDELQVRWRSGGERCQLPGRAQGTSLKKLLQEWGIPPWWRDRVPLLYLEGELLAVVGLALCQSSRLSSGGDSPWQVNWRRA